MCELLKLETEIEVYRKKRDTDRKGKDSEYFCGWYPKVRVRLSPIEQSSGIGITVDISEKNEVYYSKQFQDGLVCKTQVGDKLDDVRSSHQETKVSRTLRGPHK